LKRNEKKNKKSGANSGKRSENRGLETAIYIFNVYVFLGNVEVIIFNMNFSFLLVLQDFQLTIQLDSETISRVKNGDFSGYFIFFLNS
jgi:hypothetical protein